MSSSISNIKREKRQMLENYIRDNLSKYKPILTCDSDAIFVMDLDGFFIPLNPSCESIFGYERDQFLKMTYMKVVSLDYLERTLSFFYKALEGQLQNFDCQIIHKNGEILDVNITNYPIIIDDEIAGVYGVAKNITAIKKKRRRLMEEIRQREETYREIVEHSPDAVIIAGKKSILFANDTAVYLFGAREKDDIIGKNALDFLHPAYLEIVQKRIQIVQNGQPVDFIEQKLIRLDGQMVDVEVKSIPTIYQNIPARHIIIRDITEKKRTQKLLLESEKLTVAGQLAAGIAHEIRNPLTAIKGFLQLMEVNNASDHSYIDIINSEMNRIELILSELLILAKPQEFKFEKNCLKTILEHVKALIDTQANLNNTKVIIHYSTEIQEIRCDENQLKQVFINFLKNSIEAMPNGGEIKIVVKQHNDDHIQISFIDQGCGIPSENLERIGQPFFSTKESGTGLGLMISKQIIENHKGKFEISSDTTGTTINVTLPL
ncbi:PAS domain-containing sensor histidine kinase [Neobacillus mesonae]|uniref:PAS domain-containing sensor histidine kinase n=1 Tax=Neobacillus mesonae TaxID=1193713 RepID=UPI002042026F|nr:PAS domain-containing sensor histidine kinase [Neobacillus mesonae]MCM3568027.1 PAS domain S-box protein [Neobacillus mesonae]